MFSPHAVRRLGSCLAMLFLATTSLAQQEAAQQTERPANATEGTSEENKEGENKEGGKEGGAEAEKNPYVGDAFTRQRMTGDWFGARSLFVENGLNFDVSHVQFYQGVTSGGRQDGWQYGGKLDYLFDFDGGKFGLWEGFIVNLHAETRYGESVNTIDGLMVPSNIIMHFPKDGETITALTGIKFTQALSENFVIYGGKLNTLDDFPLRFTPTEGLKPGQAGFQSTALVFNPIVARTIPYAAIGNGFAILKDKEPIFSFTVFDPRERATIGFQKPYAEGVVLLPDLILRTNPDGLLGVWNFGGTWSSARYRSLDPEAYLQYPPEIIKDAAASPQETGSWSLYFNFYQALWADPNVKRRTWGVFGSFGLADGNPNPFDYTLACGIGGRSMLPGRTYDTFGVGYYYLGLSNNFKDLTQPILPQRDEFGVEMFYNLAVTPWCRFTWSSIIARPSTVGLDTALIQGLRFQLLY